MAGAPAAVDEKPQSLLEVTAQYNQVDISQFDEQTRAQMEKFVDETAKTVYVGR